jgi:endonuclease YncB( thermonuclease family)
LNAAAARHPDIRAALIRSGFATEYRRYSKGAYAEAEAQARTAGRGQWRAASPSRP